MRSGFFLMIRAISTLVVGIAFVLSGCYPRPAGKIETGREVLLDQFDLAERDFKAGNYDKAIEGYELYLRQNPKGDKPRTALYRMAKINQEKAVNYVLNFLLNGGHE